MTTTAVATGCHMTQYMDLKTEPKGMKQVEQSGKIWQALKKQALQHHLMG